MHTTRFMARGGLLLPLVLVLSACDGFDTEPDVGIYRAVIDTPAGDLPFGLQIEGALRADGAGIAVFLLDGSERFPVKDLRREDRRFDMTLPGGAGALVFTARGRELAGTVTLIDGSGDAREFDFSAETGVAYRFYAEAETDNADVAGRWSVAMAGTAEEGVLDLTQSHDLVSGAYHEPRELNRIVTGQVHGDAFRLASFKGSRAELWTADVTDTGVLEGSYWSSIAGQVDWSARRNPDAGIPGSPQESPEEL